MHKLLSVTFLLLLSLLGETLVHAETTVISEKLESAIIIGSAEHPDPILEKVQDLEKQGILTNVIIMESFPVQIKVTGSKNVIKELQEMPRKISPNFK